MSIRPLDFNQLQHQMANAQPVGSRTPFIPAGTHLFVVEKYSRVPSAAHGEGFAAHLVVVQTDNPALKVGSVVSEQWFPNKSPAFPSPTNQEVDRATDFIMKLMGWDAAKAAGAISYLCNEGLTTQPTRGRAIKCVGVYKPAALKKDGTMGKEFTYRNFEQVPQTDAEVASRRAQVEAMLTAQATAGAIAPQAAQPPAPMANPFGGAPASTASPFGAPVNPFGGAPAPQAAPAANPFGPGF